MSVVYYPQIGGVSAQFPVTTRFTRPAYANDVMNGSGYRMSNSAAAEVAWDLRYADLNDAEWQQLEQFFIGTSGRFGAFTFLDPFDNLLSWSEDFSQAVWAAGPLLQITPGVPDPVGTSVAAQAINGSQAPERLSQAIAGPSWFQYCFSIYLRSDSPCDSALLVSATTETVRRPIHVGMAWSHAWVSAGLSIQADGLTFSLEIPPGASVEIFGAQVEAQPGASTYKKTASRGGVYTNCRFDQDVLMQKTDGMSRHLAAVRIKTVTD